MSGWFSNWQHERTERKNAKWGAMAVGYQAGIDPRAAAFSALKDGIGAATNLGGAALSGGFSLLNSGGRPKEPAAAAPRTDPNAEHKSDNTVLIVLGLAVLAILAFGKKLFGRS